MKNNQIICILNQKLIGILVVGFLLLSASGQAGERDVYQIKIYSLENEQQEIRMDNYLKDAFIPALHRAGIKHVGVFKPFEEDEMAGKLIYVLIPFDSVSQFGKLSIVLNEDKKYQEDGKDYINAAHNDAPYKRIESILLRSFASMPEYGIPKHTSPPSERIYELRSYEGATEKLYEKKVEMFNEGGESKIFIELGFQPIFFGEVISGPAMPNLMYLTTFENKASQEKLWDAFRNSSDWDKLKADEQYRNTVSHIDKYFLHPAAYSDL